MAIDLALKKKDFLLLFLTKGLRMASYGMIAIVMIKNLELKKFTGEEIGLIQFAVIFGDILISFLLTRSADKLGRRNTLIIGSILKILTGIMYAQSSSLFLLVITGVFGVISVTGSEFGPFLPIEQSALSQIIEECSDSKENIAKDTSKYFGYYGMVGYISQAIGAIMGGILYEYLVSNQVAWSQIQATNFFFYIYAMFGLLKSIAYWMIDNTNSIQAKVAPQQEQPKLNLAGIDPKNFKTIMTICVLFACDAFGSAFIAKSFISYYFYQRYNIVFASVGVLLFFCNIVSGISGVLSSRLVQKIGVMSTMIFTHLPSNFFLLAIPFVSNSFIAMLLLFGRFCISQMNVPARQTYVNMAVSSSERSAANGLTNIARSVGLSIGMGLNGYFISLDPESFSFTIPFLLAGGIKTAYDIALWVCFLWRNKAKKDDEHLEFVDEVTNGESENKIQGESEIKIQGESQIKIQGSRKIRIEGVLKKQEQVK